MSQESELQKGKDRLFGSVAWNWASHIVFIVAGFLLPRAIDTALGQEDLGLWDFAWSIAGYLTLMQLGLGSSVNRYVARYRAQSNPSGLNTAISSVLGIQAVLGIGILMIAAIVAYGLLPLTERFDSSQVADIQFIVVALGLSLGLRTAFGAYDGVLTGMHRWDIYNSLLSGFHAITIAAMIVLLYKGFGLSALAATYAAGSAGLVITRLLVAHRLCPELRVGFRFVSREAAAEMMRFSLKSFLSGIAKTVLYQSNAVLLGLAAGPAVLAVYARPLSLVSQSSAFVAKLANPLTPIIGAAQAESADREVQAIAIASSRVSATLSLCGMVLLAWVGGDIVEIWMGAAYRDDLLIAALAIGHIFTIGHKPLMTVLIGLNAHGTPALYSIATAVLSAVIAFVLFVYDSLTLLTAALTLVVSILLVDGILIPRHICRFLRLGYFELMTTIWRRPLYVASPLLLCWFVSSGFRLLDSQRLIAVAVSVGLTCALFFKTYPLSQLSRKRRKASGT